MGPGGIHNNSKHANCTGGAAGYIDRLLIGEQHLRWLRNVHVVYRTSVVFDPESSLGRCLNRDRSTDQIYGSGNLQNSLSFRQSEFDFSNVPRHPGRNHSTHAKHYTHQENSLSIN